MGVLNTIGGIVMIITSIVIMAAVAMQESPKGGGLNALTGGDSYFSKNQSRTRDALLSRITKICAFLFFVITIVVSVANVYFA